MRICLLHNPSAGTGAHSCEDLEELLRAAGHQVRSHPVPRRKDPLPELGDAELVVIAGGDGAVRKTLLRSREIGRPCTILPLGTANNVATCLGLRGAPEELVRRWPDFRVRSVDLGDARGPWGTEPFVEGVGVGLLPRAMALIERLDSRSRWTFSSPADELYRDACGVALVAAELSPFPVELCVDGETERADVLGIEISNFGRGGPRLSLAPGADPGDGLLDVVLVTDADALVWLAMDGFAGSALDVALPVRRGRRVELRAAEVPCRVDDKLTRLGRGATEERLEVRLVGGAAELLAPPPVERAASARP